ncbi:MAG: hypothetical protein ACFFG0_05955 [Candidatus Thorarchaeota archaeon]
MKSRKDTTEERLYKLDSVKESGELIDKVETGIDEGTVLVDTSQISEDLAVAEEDPITSLLDVSYEGETFRRFVGRGILDLKVLTGFKNLLKREYRLLYDFDVFLVLSTGEVYNIKQNEKAGGLTINDLTTLRDIFNEFGIDPDNPRDGFFIVPKDDGAFEFTNTFKGILGTTEIFSDLSETDREEFMMEFSRLYRSIALDLEFGGLELTEIAYEAAFNEFIDRNEKYIQDPGKTVLDKEWHNYLVKVWDHNYKNKVMVRRVFSDSYKNVVALALQGAILASLLKQRVSTAGEKEIVPLLLEDMRNPNIIQNLLSAGLFGDFILNVFAQTFHQSNQHQINVYSSQVHTRNGVLSEALAELELMSSSLDELYNQYRDQITEFPVPIYSYSFTKKATTFRGPRLDMGDMKDYRDLDTFGIRYFVVREGSDYKRVGTLSNVKHTRDMSGIISDAVSAAYAFIRDSVDREIVIQDNELYINLVTLLYETVKLVPGDFIPYEKLVSRTIDAWFKAQYDSNLVGGGIIKGSKQDIFEADIINALNTEIWKEGSSLSREDVARKLAEILEDPDFVQSKIINIYGHIDNRLYVPIRRFIRNILDNIDLMYTDIGTITAGVFEVRKGLMRNVEKSDYFVTDYKVTLEQLKKLGITKIFDSGGRHVGESELLSRELVNDNNELNGQFRVLTSIDGEERVIIEVGGEYTTTPMGYVDGILVNQRWITNGLLTYLDGRVLSSEFFDPSLELDPIFMDDSSPRFWVDEHYHYRYINYMDNSYSNIYTVFSFSEGRMHRSVGKCIHLTDPALRGETSELYFKLSRTYSFFKPSRSDPRRSRQVQASIHCNPFQNKNPIDVYGEFSKDIFMEIFYSLFDPYDQLYTQRTQTRAMKYLSFLNGISYGTNFEEFRQGPSTKDVNYALNKLGFTESELLKLLWKRVDSETGELVFNHDQTKKEWLKLLYDKITSYSLKDGSVYAIQKARLEKLGKDYVKIDDASIARNRREFTIEEARMGKEIFEAANVIFGHFTIRLMLAKMVGYYGSFGSYGIKIVNRPPIEARGRAKSLPIEQRQYLRDFLNTVGLIPSTFQYDRPVSVFASYKSKKSTISTVSFLFGSFFLESHLYLEIENIANIKSPDNTLSFPLGPLVAITSVGGFAGKNLRGLSKSIGVFLETSYELHRKKNFDSTNVEIIGKQFLGDHDRTLEFISEKIKETIIDGHYYADPKKNIWLANQLIEHARLGLIHEKSSSKTSGYLKDQLERFMDSSKVLSRQEGFYLEFNYLMPKSKKPFRLRITQDELVDNGIVAWGKRALLDSSDYSIYRAQLLHKNSHNIRKYLSTLINIFGTNKEVRIFPLLDTGDPNTGYKFITDPEEYKFKILPEDQNYVDIDIKTREGIFKLQHIINLLYTGKFAFVVKRRTGTWNDGEMIFAINRDGFLEPHEIHSSNMRISDYSTIFRGNNDDWQRLWIYPKAWNPSHLAQNSDILSYINYIINPEFDIKYINLFIREFMNRMEILFPGYREYIKDFMRL